MNNHPYDWLVKDENLIKRKKEYFKRLIFNKLNVSWHKDFLLDIKMNKSLDRAIVKKKFYSGYLENIFLIDNYGSIIDDKFILASEFINDYVQVSKQNEEYTIDKNGNRVELNFSFIPNRLIINNLFFVKNENNEIGAVNKNNEIVIPIKYSSISRISEDLFKAKINNKYGVINSNNKTILPFKYNQENIFKSNGSIDIDLKYLLENNKEFDFVFTLSRLKNEKVWYFTQGFSQKKVSENNCIKFIYNDKISPKFSLKDTTSFRHIKKLEYDNDYFYVQNGLKSKLINFETNDTIIIDGFEPDGEKKITLTEYETSILYLSSGNGSKFINLKTKKFTPIFRGDYIRIGYNLVSFKSDTSAYLYDIIKDTILIVSDRTDYFEYKFPFIIGDRKSSEVYNLNGSFIGQLKKGENTLSNRWGVGKEKIYLNKEGEKIKSNRNLRFVKENVIIEYFENDEAQILDNKLTPIGEKYIKGSKHLPDRPINGLIVNSVLKDGVDGYELLDYKGNKINNIIYQEVSPYGGFLRCYTNFTLDIDAIHNHVYTDNSLMGGINFGPPSKGKSFSGLLGAYGKEILPPIYEDIAIDENLERIIIQKQGKLGLANYDGEILIEPSFNNVTDLYESIRK